MVVICYALRLLEAFKAARKFGILHIAFYRMLDPLFQSALV